MIRLMRSFFILIVSIVGLLAILQKPIMIAIGILIAYNIIFK